MEKKSITINGRRITKKNFLAFAESSYSEGALNILKEYLEKLLDLSGSWRLDHWDSAGSFNAYEVGNEWITIYKDDLDRIEKWLAE